ncbi:MAG: alpha/beta fold hydrolase [Roseateles sp.]
MVALVAAVGLGFGRMVDHVAIRDSGLHPPSVGHVAFAVHVDDGIDMPVYSTGAIQIGCVVIFPGQHGLAGGFEGHIAPLMASRGVAVFTPTYASTPNGPKLTLEQARRFASEVVGQVEKRCGPRYVVVGRSLGSMVAAYAVKNHRPAALLLEGASPSLAMAVRSALGRRLVQVPMPLERLLIKNYSLRDALGAEQRFPVTIFQGTLDLQTPIADLTEPGAVPSWIEIVQVPDADHQGTWKAAMPQIADRITGALTNRAL